MAFRSNNNLCSWHERWKWVWVTLLAISTNLSTNFIAEWLLRPFDEFLITDSAGLQQSGEAAERLRTIEVETPEIIFPVSFDSVPERSCLCWLKCRPLCIIFFIVGWKRRKSNIKWASYWLAVWNEKKRKLNYPPIQFHVSLFFTIVVVLKIIMSIFCTKNIHFAS